MKTGENNSYQTYFFLYQKKLIRTNKVLLLSINFMQLGAAT